jgi:hypothetical protein
MRPRRGRVALPQDKAISLDRVVHGLADTACWEDRDEKIAMVE